MGLDMYLTIRKSVSRVNWEATHAQSGEGYVEYPTYSQLIETAGLGKYASDESLTADVSVTAMYWRKENAIHEWFVKNCQGGVDECQTAYVSRAKIAELVKVCAEVMRDFSKASELLPTQSGFFFGGTEYDEWYFQGVQRTHDELSRLLQLAEGDDSVSFEYQSSW
jgi:hypothetical protein